jgi:CRISPR type III-A-associated protein Csm2
MSEEQNAEIVETPAPEPVVEEAVAPAEPAPVEGTLAAQLKAVAGLVATPPSAKPPQQQSKPEGQRPQQQRPAREDKPREEKAREDKPREDKPRGDRPQGGDRGPRPGGGPPHRDRGDRPQGDRGPRPGGDRGPDRGGDRPRFEFPEIELEKLIADSLYLDNQAHAIVSRMRDMDTGTKSQLRRLYNAVRRAVRAPEGERQHEFVMLRARLAYTIARHSLRSLDQIEKLLLQVTRKNETRGYERFKDLFEAVIAYNE